jgi:tRNA-binding EMAP/Myf-like protein
MVLVAANLKAKKLGGFPSHGMVLCASTADSLTFVDPPKGAKPGDAVALPGLANPPASEAQVDKKKLFAKAQPHFVVRNGTCYYKDKPFDVNGAPCTASVADGASIS